VPGLAWYKPAPAKKPARARARRRQAPLRVCGQCTGSFRSWTPDKICGRCLEDGEARPAPAGGPFVATLGGPADDGSLHYLMTGEPEPAA